MPALPGLRDVRTGWFAWGAFALAVLVFVLVQPGRAWVDDVYRVASEKWWSSDATLYGDGPNGFLYLPAFPPLFTPFAFLPLGLARALWRLACLLVLATGVRRLVRLHGGGDALFPLATLLSLAATWSSMRTGQTNLAVAGLFLHLAVDLREARAWRSAVLVGVLVVLKPVALAPALVVGVLWPGVGWRSAALLAGVALLPFLHADPDYVLRMHGEFFDKMRAAEATPRRYETLLGLLGTLGVGLPPLARTALPALGGAVVFALSWLAVRRLGRQRAALPVVALHVCWWMLFSPRTETNSYVILVPFLAVVAASLLLLARRPAAGLAVAVLALALGSDVYGLAIHRATDFWLKPVVALIVLVALTRRVLSSRVGPVTGPA